MKTISVLITMDVEPVLPGKRPDGATGPNNYEESERSIRGYVQMAADYNYPVSFMIHPEVTNTHSELFQQLESEGACMGLHLHPWKFNDGFYKEHFGCLSYTQQTAILSEAIAIWMNGMGYRPKWFRPGTFSANDSTMSVLNDVGFAGGSISLPGRVYPDMCAVWSGAPFDPHFGHATFRLLEGELPFINIPLSVDNSRKENRDGNHFYWDLRPDWEEADYHNIANNIVTQILDRKPVVPVLQMVTHNDNDFTSPTNRVRNNFAIVLREITNACRTHGLDPIGDTFAGVDQKLRRTNRQKQSFRFAHTSMLTGQ
jgi:hypothetical protein